MACSPLRMSIKGAGVGHSCRDPRPASRKWVTRHRTGTRIESGNEIEIDSNILQYERRRNTFYVHVAEVASGKLVYVKALPKSPATRTLTKRKQTRERVRSAAPGGEPASRPRTATYGYVVNGRCKKKMWAESRDVSLTPTRALHEFVCVVLKSKHVLINVHSVEETLSNSHVPISAESASLCRFLCNHTPLKRLRTMHFILDRFCATTTTFDHDKGSSAPVKPIHRCGHLRNVVTKTDTNVKWVFRMITGNPLVVFRDIHTQSVFPHFSCMWTVLTS
ncbi:hypothetical protein EVAR_46196_1 [Eumeta japonica]|uniref:Uncharacterized protein n=1 Tax=Eumeta variegata TaxID=151549 RepID=A0A4C1WCR2_EUMVA|nr:hypothetical protein EVAR_46196_1 [Eumeta japonica]